jgi:hypothetical protein
MSKKCLVCNSYSLDDDLICFYCGNEFEIIIEDLVVEEENEILIEEVESKVVKNKLKIGDLLIRLVIFSFIVFWLIYYLMIFIKSYASLI